MGISEQASRRDQSEYPQHLRAYEALDRELLPVAGALDEFTFDDFVARVRSPRARAVAVRWLASAEWRRLIERSLGSPRVYTTTPHGRDALRRGCA
jgi:hypothetical protein